MALKIMLNGEAREFAGLQPPLALEDLVAALGLKPDRIAVERNGLIAHRTSWQQTQLVDGDRLEIVHFVGGGATPEGGKLRRRRNSPLTPTFPPLLYIISVIGR